ALERLRAAPELASQAAGLAGSYDLQRIEARLAGLEQSVSATLNILSQLLEAVRRDEPATDKTE
ncbi:MAG: ATPase, partial [Thauera sp.]